MEHDDTTLAAATRRDHAGRPTAGTDPRVRLAVAGTALAVLAIMGIAMGWWLGSGRTGEPESAAADVEPFPAATQTMEPTEPPDEPDPAPTGDPSGDEEDPQEEPSGEPVMALQVTELQFGGDATTRELTVRNSGDATLGWQVDATSQGVTVQPAEGRLEPLATTVVQVMLDRDRLPEGDHETALSVVSDGGDARVVIRASVDRPPVISQPVAGVDALTLRRSDEACPHAITTVAAEAWDESGVDEVRLRWEGPASEQGSAVMELAPDFGDDWYSTALGPFAETGEVRFWVEATDMRGNSSHGATAALPVEDDCPSGDTEDGD